MEAWVSVTAALDSVTAAWNSVAGIEGDLIMASHTKEDQTYSSHSDATLNSPGTLVVKGNSGLDYRDWMR